VQKRITRLVSHSKYPIFVFGGIAIYLYEVVLTYTLTEFFNVWYYLAYVIAVSTGSCILFLFHRSYTFQQMDKKIRRLVKFVFVLGVINLMNLTFVFVTVERFGIHYMTAITLAAATFSVLNYQLNKIWVFREYQRTPFTRNNKVI
jgi:putative flippase GtrA